MLEELSLRKIQGCGFDISEPLVHAARKRGLTVSVADATQLEVPEATLVIALGEVLAYCSVSDNVALENIVRSAADSLVPGGHLVFDVTGPEMTESANWSESEDWFVASRTEIIDEVYLVRHISVFSRDGDLWQRADEVHRLMLLDSDRVNTLLDRCGLTVEPIVSLGDTKLLPGRNAYLARKND